MANIAEVLKELQQEHEQLGKAIAALTPLASNGSAAVRRTRGSLSAAARRRIAAAQRARWAKVRARKSAQPPSGKRVLSIGDRKKIAAAQRARWAKVRKEKKAA